MSEPNAQAGGLVGGRDLEQLVKRNYQASDRALSTSRKLDGIDEDEPVVHLSTLVGGIGDGAEVSYVLADYRSALLLSHGEYVCVG